MHRGGGGGMAIHVPRLYGVVNRRSGLISDHHASCTPIGLPINRSMAEQ